MNFHGDFHNAIANKYLLGLYHANTILCIQLYLFTTVRWQIEDEDSEEGDAHAWYNQIDSVEQCFSAHRDVKGDIKVRFITASIIFNISNSRDGQDVPLDRHVELGEVDADVDYVFARLLFFVS